MGDNILQPLFDSVWDSGVIFFKWLFDGWIEDKKDLNIFFKSIGLKNKLEEYPTIVKQNEKGILLTIPIGLSSIDFIKHQNSLETYLNKNIIINTVNGFIFIEYKKELPKIVEYKLPKQINDLCIPFAESINGLEYINFKEEPHILLTGSTGSGKSITLRNILTSIVFLYPNNIDLILIDFKIVELAIFKKLKQVKTYVTEVEQAKEVIADELEECQRRYKLFEKLEVTNIYDYNKKVSKDNKLKYRFIVIEEFVMLTADKKKIAMNMLKRLASISRASGQFLIITGQRFDNTVIDLVLRANIGHRLCHKMQDEANSRLILDEVGAEKINNKGRMIYKCGSDKIECQSYYITDNQIKDIIKPHTTKANKSHSNTSNYNLQDKKNKIPINQNKKGTTAYTKNKLDDLTFLDNL